MAKVNFNDVPNQREERANSSNGVGFFSSLKDDGDETIVRFMHDTTDSFDIASVHNVTVGGRFRKVNCLRDSMSESLSSCPLCETGEKLQTRIFIHLIEYTKGQNGEVVANPKVWERSIAYATKLKDFMEDYSPLSDYVFKVKRRGAKGSMDTTYSIVPLNPTQYPSSMFPKLEDAFKDYNVIGRVILDKNADEMRSYVQTGDFPVNTVKKEETRPETPIQSSTPSTNTWGTTTNTTTSWSTPAQTRAPWEAPVSNEPKSPSRFF